MQRKDCINWNETNPSLRNHCTALKNEYGCTSDCCFYAPMDKEKLRLREAEIDCYTVKVGEKNEA